MLVDLVPISKIIPGPRPARPAGTRRSRPIRPAPSADRSRPTRPPGHRRSRATRTHRSRPGPAVLPQTSPYHASRGDPKPEGIVATLLKHLWQQSTQQGNLRKIWSNLGWHGNASTNHLLVVLSKDEVARYINRWIRRHFHDNGILPYKKFRKKAVAESRVS